MNHISPLPIPPRAPAVEPELLASAIFLFSEYLRRLAGEIVDIGEDEPEEAGEDEGPEIDTREILDLFAEELGTSVQVTLNLYMRVTALYRLFASSPSLAHVAIDQEDAGGALTEDALVAAARLELHVMRMGSDGAADFDPREFRRALESG